MNTNNFKTFVEALEALPDEVKHNVVHMGSIDKPTCKTAGCFAGLISIVADDMPELKNLYNVKDYRYLWREWENALDKFLGCSFRHWARDNPNAWGNPEGRFAFSFPEAYGTREMGEALTHNGIIVHLRNAYENWVKFENEVGHD